MKKNKSSTIDVCFLIASSAKKSYQQLSETYAAIEPPTWALLLHSRADRLVLKFV